MDAPLEKTPVPVGKNSLLVIIGICIVMLLLVLIALLIIKKPNYQAMNTYQIAYKDNAVQNGATEIIVQQGDTITFLVLSDIPGTFHVVGYPYQVHVPANTRTQFSLTTNQPGHFSYGFEESNSYFGSLDVSPIQ